MLVNARIRQTTVPFIRDDSRSGRCERGFGAYLVGAVVVLRVILEYLLLLRVVPGGQQLVKLGVFPPLLSIDEPAVG